MTTENSDDTTKFAGDIEDRLFTITTPFLSTGVRKSHDRLYLSLGGWKIIPGIEILPFLDNEGPKELRQLSALDDSAAGDEMSAVDAYGRPLAVNSKGTALASARHGRRLSNEFVDNCPGAFDFTKYLVESHAGDSEASASMTIDLGLAMIRGGFSISPVLVVGFIGGLCMDKWQIQLGFHIETGEAWSGPHSMHTSTCKHT